MLFNSIEYLIFFPIVVMLYFTLPIRWRWVLLLVASYFFYMCWKAEYVVLIMITTLIDYLIGLKLAQKIPKKQKKAYLLISIIANLGMLAGFKYLNFFTQSISDFLKIFNDDVSFPVYNILLPVGISFYIFQSLSYTIDVYRGNSPAEKHLGMFALYVSFFPQLVAGPIERPTSLIPQFHKPKSFDPERAISGLKLMLWGFFKKLVIADRLGMFVNIVYEHPDQHKGITVILASALFAFQLYCDFSAYTDIARGSARVMGFDLMVNFNRPFIAKSLRDFWSRWHISLTTWFRDYLLYSLPYVKNNEVKFSLFNRNVIITLLLMGFWHGASWAFIFFGLFHGIMLVLENTTGNARNRIIELTHLNKDGWLLSSLSMVATFSILVFSLYFFRAENITDAFILLRNSFDFSGSAELIVQMLKNNELTFGILMVICLLIAEYLQAKKDLVSLTASKPMALRWSLYSGFVFFILIFGVLHQEKFIYFQF
jgi:alginate O-acetyltransferase complex protein AlgI